MLEEITPEQFDEWLAYSSIEPLDDELSREILVRMAYGICRCLGADVQPEDFRPNTDPVPIKQPAMSDRSVKANLAAFAALHNASLQ